MRDCDQPGNGAHGGPTSPGVAGRDAECAAEHDAACAARRAGVRIRAAGTVAELRLVADLFSRIWDAPVVAPLPHDLMRSLVHAGGHVHAAYRWPAGGRKAGQETPTGRGEPVLAGASVAVFGPPGEASCYSLIAGVSPGGQGRGIGLALKLAQRAWALHAGATHMRWTYDPLLRRNARFNLMRLGATVTEYLVDFYGAIADGVNDPETDRVAVTWDLAAPLVARAGEPEPFSGSVPPAILSAGPGGEPVRPQPSALASGDAPARVHCWVPDDILAIRRRDTALARRWRFAMRESLGGALRQGYRVTGVTRPGWYVLERERTGHEGDDHERTGR